MKVPGRPVVHWLDMAQSKAPGDIPPATAIMQQHVAPTTGKLKAYTAVNAFSHFGKPFDHLRGGRERRMLKDDQNTPCGNEILHNIAVQTNTARAKLASST